MLICAMMVIGAWRSLVSALPWGGRGREFKSPRPDQAKKPIGSGFPIGFFFFSVARFSRFVA